jgi:hypothetical protein
MCSKFQVKFLKYDFFQKPRLSLQGSLENRYIKKLITSPNHYRNPNSFRIFPRILCTICRQNIIIIGRAYLARFPREQIIFPITSATFHVFQFIVSSVFRTVY